MSWEEFLDEHNRRLLRFTGDIRSAHAHSSNHRKEILDSSKCGCFYCGSIFSPEKIHDWVDEGTTALCPYCGIDSVIGDKSGYDVSIEFLSKMCTYWFGGALRNT